MHQGSLLKKLINTDERSISEIADKLNISRGTIYQLYGRETLTDEYIQLFKTIGINFENNMTTINKKHDKNQALSPKDSIGLSVHKIPLYDIDAMAGNMSLFAESHKEYIIDWVDLPSLRNTTACIGVMGDSMYPTYKRGDIIAIKEVKDYGQVEYGQCYVLITDENIFLKRIDKHTDKGWWGLRSDNVSYGQMEINQGKVTRLYKVRGSIRTEAY